MRLHVQIEILTKGDNNRVDDRGLYAPGQMWLKRSDILGTHLQH
jgi:signal peptidase I